MTFDPPRVLLAPHLGGGSSTELWFYILREAEFNGGRRFRMVDLLLFAFEGKKALLAPLG